MAVKFENAMLSYATREFQTDSGITSSRGFCIGDKELTPWDGGVDEESLEEMDLSTTSSKVILSIVGFRFSPLLRIYWNQAWEPPNYLKGFFWDFLRRKAGGGKLGTPLAGDLQDFDGQFK